MNMVNMLKLDLADNYRTTDEAILKEYITLYSEIASQTSNRNIYDKLIQPLVYLAVKEAYIRRGEEGIESSNEGGHTKKYVDIEEKLRKDCLSIRKGNF